MTISWDTLTPIDDNNQANAPVSWDDLQPEDTNQVQPYKKSPEDRGWEISATPKEDTTLLGRLGKTLKWVAQTPIYAYMQGSKNVESAELNAKEIFQSLSDTEKNKLNTLENSERNNFGVPQNVEYADENITNLGERASNAIKTGYAETFENLTTSVEVAKAGGIGSAVVGGLGALGGALWGLRKARPIEGALDGFKVGARLGGGTGAARKSFELEAGFARQELKQMRDKDGNPLPEDLIKNASIAVGVINSTLESIGLVAELKTFPGMDKLFFKSKKDLIENIAENKTLKDTLIQVGKTYAKSIGTESSTEMVQECSNILAEELSKKIAGNYNDKLVEDGEINNEALNNHIARVIKSGVSAVGPSVIIGGLGTTMTAVNILRKNGMPKKTAQTTADNMNVDERADFINQNIDTLDKIAQDHITEMEAQDIEKNFFDKASEVYKDTDGNLSAEKENQVLSAAKIAGAFAKKFGSNKQQVQDWFNKLSFQNKPLEGGVSVNVQANNESKTSNLIYDAKKEDLSRTHSAPIAEEEINPADSLGDNWQNVNPEAFGKEFGDTPENIEAMLSADMQDILDDNATDDAFNMFADAKLKIKNSLGTDVNVDINPINTEKSGTIDEPHLNKLESKENTYFQSATPENTVDLTNEFDKTPTIDEVKNYINELVENGTKFATLSPDWFIDIQGGNRVKGKLINRSNYKGLSKLERKRHKKYVIALEKLLANAEYSGSKENIKLDKKPNVANYHYFTTNAKIGDKTYKIVLDTEEYNNEKPASVDYAKRNFKETEADTTSITNSDRNFNPKTVHLYNITEINNKITGMKGDFNPESGLYLQENKSIEELHKENAINKKQKTFEYLGYFKEDQDKNIIGIMQDANPSTIVHEMGHLFLQGLNEFSQTDAKAKAMLEEVNNWLGYSAEGYTIEQHEKFARGFEAYLYNGNAPSNTLREAFENFKEWLRSIYNHVDELGVSLTPEVQRIFDNMFSDKKEKQDPIKDMVDKAKNISINGKLSDYELRHKETAYNILSVATGKSKTWLKTILESNSENSKILKSKEKIQFLSENVEDRIRATGGFLPEWSEFFFNPGIGKDTHADYQLASAAYNTIVDKTYLNNHSGQFGFLDVTEAQYQYLLDQFKKVSDRDIPLAAFWDWLEYVDVDFVSTYAEKYENDVAYIERFEKMDKFAQAKEIILKSAHEAGLYSINEVDKYKNIVMATIKGLNFLNPIAKARLSVNILDYSSVALLEANIDNLLDIAKTIEDIEYKKRLVNSIHKELQFTKNIKQNNKTVGKYDYQTNKIFEKMREIEALSAEQANEMRLAISELHEENGLSFEDKIINSFINYKANGLTFTSTESAKSMYDDIIKMKLTGKEAKSEQDFQNKLNLASDVIELVRILDKKKAAKLPTKWYLQVGANWESMINGLFNKDMRNKYSLLAPQRLSEGWIYNEKKTFENQVAQIYGKTIFDFDDAIIKNLNTKMSFLENVEDVENVGEFRQVPREMNKMEIILAWMWDKNEVLHQRLFNQFGDIELERMFNELSDDDIKLSNLMMQTVNKYYTPANEAFIKKYGIDLPRVSNYFPSKVERISEIDLLTDFSMKSTDPSAIKHRSGNIGLSMDFDNPVKMLYQHIDSMGKFIHMTETLDKQNKIFKNKTLRKIIIEKYGEDIYNEMLKMFMNNAYKQEMTNYNWFSQTIDKLVSNWLIANVSVKPSIAIKQLLSASNYASEMPYLKWKLGYLKAIADPKGTIEYMNKIPYLKARFEMGGQNEFLKNEINNSKLAKTARLKEWASVNIRMGDIGAIAFGGRPYLEYLMKEKGLSEESAIKEFLDHTQRTMQASETSTLNNFQIAMAKGGFGSKLLTAYKNAQWQYLRMAGDSIVSYANGDITGPQMGKTLFMYLFLNPFLYRSATSLSLVTLLATGKDDDLKKDILSSIFDMNADAIAVFGDLYQYAVAKLILKENGMPDKTPLIGDVQAHINKITKQDVSIDDWLNFAGYGAQVLTGVPINAVALSLSGAGDIAQGKYLKGSLKALGWSEYRSANASGEKKKTSKRKSKKHKLNLD